jgi:hypothetical protein
MHPYSDTGCEIVWLCVKPCQMCCVQTRTAIQTCMVVKNRQQASYKCKMLQVLNVLTCSRSSNKTFSKCHSALRVACHDSGFLQVQEKTVFVQTKLYTLACEGEPEFRDVQCESVVH